MGISGLKRQAWRGLAGAYRLLGAPQARHRGTAVIVTYHRVLSEEDLSTEVVQPAMYVRTDVFRMQMEYLQEHFEILSMAALLDRWLKGTWNRESAACIITFDDGWLDNYRNAFPILKHFSLPATVFVPTDFIGTSRWFWPEQLGYLVRAMSAPSCKRERRASFYAALRAGLEAGLSHFGEGASREAPRHLDADAIIELCKVLEPAYLSDLLTRLGKQFDLEIPEKRVVMNWEEVREMSKHGISFGSHSCSHRLLDRLSQDECRAEATASYDALRKSGANVLPVFCYPNGNYDATAKEVIRAAGYQAAVSCHVGLEGDRPSDLFALRRISLHNDISETPSLLALAISGLR